MISLHVDPHPLLNVRAFTTTFPRPLGELSSSTVLLSGLKLEAEAPVESSDVLRGQVRDLLRHGGYKPTGRGKPASEYLLRAATEGQLSSINVAVDACNAASLHSGLPISVVDLDLAQAPFRIGVAAAEERYVFNASGQQIDLQGLLCLLDAQGPCANAVKDAQRTKTHAGTVRTLSIIWSPVSQAPRAQQTRDWYAQLLTAEGAVIEDVAT